MAVLLETLAVPRASGFPTASLSPIACSSVSAFSGRRESVALPQSRGLKIQSVKSTRSLISSSRHGLRGGLIVCEAQGTAVEVTAVTDKTWQSLVLEADVPVMVEFWAPWCGPCRMITPIIDELAKQYQGKLNSYKLNTDECPKIASNYGIRSIPTVMIFKGGEKKEAVIGAVPKSTLETSLEKFL